MTDSTSRDKTGTSTSTTKTTSTSTRTTTTTTTTHQPGMNGPDTDSLTTTSSASSSKGKGDFSVLLFGPLSTYCNDTEQLTLSGPMTILELFQEMENRFPGVNHRILRSCQVVCGLEYLDINPVEIVDLVLSRSQPQPHSHSQSQSARGEGHLQSGSQSQSQSDGPRLDETLSIVILPGDEVGFVPPVSSG